MANGQTARSSRQSIFDGRYEIVSTVGRGRNSVVYKARHLEPEKHQDEFIALKVLTGHAKNPDANFERLKREALAMLASRNEHVIPLRDYIASGELCYLAMEYAERGDLRQELRRAPGPLSPKIALHLTHRLLKGLEVIHRGGIIHRDIKPENLLVTKNGILKIADFSIAYLPTGAVSFDEGGPTVGTFEYLAPEYLEHGTFSQQSDIYSVGVTLFELLTKNFPFDGETLTTQIESKISGKQRLLANYIESPPALLDELIHKALTYDPKERFESASEFREAIELFYKGEWRPNSKRTRQKTVMLTAASSVARERNLYEVQNEQLQASDHLLRRVQQQSLEHEESNSEFDQTTQHTAPYEAAFEDKPRRLWPALLLALFLLGSVTFWLQDSLYGLPELPAQLQMVKNFFSSSDTSTKFGTISRTLSGTLRDFHSEDQSLPLSATILAPGHQMLFAVGLPGWQPVILDTSAWEEGRPVILQNGEFSVQLWKDYDLSVADSNITGYYKDQSTGRSGLWEVQ